MSATSIRLALGASALGLALVLSPSASAGGKPAKPPAGKPPPVKPAAEPATFSELTQAYDRKEEEATKEIRKQRYEATLAYVKAKGSAEDVAEARESLVDLAEAMEDHEAVVRHADEFLAAHGSSVRMGGVLVQKASALASLGRHGDAKAILVEQAKEAKADQQGFNAWMRYAALLDEMDDVAGAKEAYEKLKELIPQVGERVDGEIQSLEMAGQEPAPFPEGLKDMQGKDLSLADYKGKVLLVDFWATWCGPCVQEMPNVVKAYAHFHAAGLEILGVTLDGPDAAKKIHDFETEKGMTWRQYYDGKQWENELAQHYGVHGIPHTMLIDREGKIVRVGLRGDALHRRLQKLVSAAAEAPKKD